MAESDSVIDLVFDSDENSVVDLVFDSDEDYDSDSFEVSEGKFR